MHISTCRGQWRFKANQYLTNRLNAFLLTFSAGFVGGMLPFKAVLHTYTFLSVSVVEEATTDVKPF